jgi:antitoxin component of MazEF toxin-antitoxin module
MVRKIFRTGNSMVVSLPKNALDQLGMEEGADVHVELDQENRQIVIRPVELPIAGSIDDAFAHRVADLIEKYRPALEALAKK